MSVFQQFREILQQRLQAILWRSMASSLEADAAIQDIDNLERIEDRARQLDAEGKPQLAQRLREKAAGMDAQTPGESIHEAVQQLGTLQEPRAESLESARQLLGGPSASQAGEVEAAEAKASRAGRAKRRQRRAKANQSEEAE